MNYLLKISCMLACTSGSIAGQARACTPLSSVGRDFSEKFRGPSTPTMTAGKWTYEQRVDKSGNTTYKAAITSPNQLQFTFPYAGGSTATLTLRHKEGVTYLYLEVSRGQFNRTFQNGNARIAFDGKPAKKYTFSAAENGRANIIFFDNESTLIAQLKKAQKMSIDVEFYAQGRRTIEFDTVGLVWKH